MEDNQVYKYDYCSKIRYEMPMTREEVKSEISGVRYVTY
jgi:hypothetical protein